MYILKPIFRQGFLDSPIRMTQATACLDHGLKDYSPQAMWEQVQQPQHLFSFMFWHDFCGVDDTSWHLLPCTGWHLQSG